MKEITLLETKLIADAIIMIGLSEFNRRYFTVYLDFDNSCLQIAGRNVCKRYTTRGFFKPIEDERFVLIRDAIVKSDDNYIIGRLKILEKDLMKYSKRGKS